MKPFATQVDAANWLAENASARMVSCRMRGGNAVTFVCLSPVDEGLRVVALWRSVGLALNKRESDVTDDITKFLTDRGWRMVRTQSGTFRGKNRSFITIGEVGMADWSCLLYRPAHDPFIQSPAHFWLEVKRPHAQPSLDQLRWQAKERARGATVIVADSLQSFIAQYLQELT